MPDARIQIHLLGPVTAEVDGAPLAVDTTQGGRTPCPISAVTRRTASRDMSRPCSGRRPTGPMRGRPASDALGPEAGLGGPGLVVDRSSVSLETAAFDVDRWRFEEALAVARGRRRPGDDLLWRLPWSAPVGRGVDRGEFMAGFALRDSEEFDEWQLAEASSHRRQLSRRSSSGWRAVRQQLEPRTRPYRPRGAGWSRLAA